MRLSRIIGNILLQILKLNITADNVIKWFTLPTCAGCFAHLIDLPSSVAKPPFALFPQIPAKSHLNQEMNVVWHYDEAFKIVAFALEFQERVRDDASIARLTQQTATVTIVEVFMPALFAELEKLPANVFRNIAPL